MAIAILCPTRNRKEQYARMVKSVRSTASSPDNVAIFSATNGNEYYVKNIMPQDCPTGFMWNVLAQAAFANGNIKLFMLGADDMVFTTPCWDKALLEHYNSLENKVHVYHLQDSRDKNGTPHPIVTREYIEKMGFFLPPIFLHWMVDSWTVEIAKANNCFTHLRNYELQHIKPSDSGGADETHKRIRSNGWHDRDMWVSEICKDYLEVLKRKLA